jgi:hypothetical protein
MSMAPPDSTQYRDATLGAEARRRALLIKRRAELAAQPLELRRVFVRRSARAVAGGVALAGSILAGAAASSASVRHLFDGLFPGHHPAVVSNLLIITGLATAMAYFVVRALAEDHFTSRMIASVRPSADVFYDLDRLELTPTRVALSMVDRVRGPSLAMIIAGAAALAPALALATYALLELGAWERPTVFEEGTWLFGSTLAKSSLVAGIIGGLWLLDFSRWRDPAALATRTAIIAAAVSLVLLGAGGTIGERGAHLWLWAACAVGASVALFVAGAIAARERAVIVAAARAE